MRPMGWPSMDTSRYAVFPVGFVGLQMVSVVIEELVSAKEVKVGRRRGATMASDRRERLKGSGGVGVACG